MSANATLTQSAINSPNSVKDIKKYRGYAVEKIEHVRDLLTSHRNILNMKQQLPRVTKMPETNDLPFSPSTTNYSLSNNPKQVVHSFPRSQRFRRVQDDGPGFQYSIDAADEQNKLLKKVSTTQLLSKGRPGYFNRAVVEANFKELPPDKFYDIIETKEQKDLKDFARYCRGKFQLQTSRGQRSLSQRSYGLDIHLAQIEGEENKIQQRRNHRPYALRKKQEAPDFYVPPNDSERVSKPEDFRSGSRKAFSFAAQSSRKSFIGKGGCGADVYYDVSSWKENKRKLLWSRDFSKLL